MATVSYGTVYRNTRTSCVSLALLCAQVSHDTLRRVLYQKSPWSRRLWECLAQGLVQKGGYLVIDDTSWERFTRVAEAGVGCGRVVGQAGVGDASGLVVMDGWEVEGPAGDSAVAERGTVE